MSDIEDVQNIAAVMLEAINLSRVAEALTTGLGICGSLLELVERVHEIDGRMGPELAAVLEAANTMSEAMAAAVEVAATNFDLSVERLGNDG